jgi:hypothetical protein
MKTEPFAYVLYIDRGTEEHFVWLYQSLDEAGDALRAYAATIVYSPSDDEIAEILAEDGIHARIYACTMKRNTQASAEVTPFARRQAA